jgi:UDP-glucose 6-dehydrogenase
MATDPAVLNGIVQEIRREAVKHRARLELADSLAGLVDIESEVEDAKTRLEILKKEEAEHAEHRASNLATWQADVEKAKEEAEKIRTDAEKTAAIYLTNVRNKVDEIKKSADSQAIEAISAAQMKVHEFEVKAEKLKEDIAKLEAAKADHHQNLATIKNGIEVMKSEHDAVVARHAEFLRSIGAK